MSEFILSLIASLIGTAISYGAYPYLFSINREVPVTKRKFMWSCIGYTLFVWFLWQMLYISSGGNTGATGPAFLWGTIFYYNAKGRLRGKGLLVEPPSKKKPETPTFDVTDQEYERAMRIISLDVHSNEVKELSQVMGKTPRETMNHFTEVVRNYNLKRYSGNTEPELPESSEQQTEVLDKPAIATKPEEATPDPPTEQLEEPSAEQPAKEPEIQRWYTCPKCGQLVKDGEECDCEAVKLALEEERKKKAEKVQQRKQALRRLLPFCALAAVLLAAVCALGFYSYTLKGQVDELSAKNNELSAKNAELAESNKKLSLESKDRLQSIYELTTENNKLKEEYSNILDDYINDIELTHFYYNKIGLIVNGSNRYHRFDCPIFQESDRFWAHNIEYCEDIGYSKCPDCW